ncbi:MAG: TonB-dependent receptor plug domain-containing protein [Gemmatimonadaceae bacterium]
MRVHSSVSRRLLPGMLAVITALIIGAKGAEAQQATISGLVSAAEDKSPLSDVRVIIVGTSTFTVTNAQGRYTLRGVSPGSYEVRVLRVGYLEQKRPISLSAGATATLDFTMDRTVVTLQQVITTATGEQRRVEIGNSVSTIDAAKVIEDSPVKNMGDLLVAKAPGVQVLPGNMTAGGSRVRIRGTSSLSLTNDPIYIIDGIRMTSNSASTGIGVGGTSPSRVNDINPDEIENIEVVKGPSAATLYGTDAANGVIVITTRKGRAGPARWNVYGENGIIQDRSNYPTMYAIFGHLPATPTTARRCFLRELGDGTCIKDSTSSLNVYDAKDLTPIKDGWRWQGGVQLTGGNDAVRYFVAGEYESETGPLGLPDIDRDRFNAAKIPIADYMDRPNTMIKGSYRANLNATVSPSLDVGVTSNFIKLDQRLPQVDNNVNSFWYNGMTGPGFRNAGPGYSGVGSLGQKLNGYNLFTPGDIFQQLTTQGVHRFINSATANWRPFSWMQNRADVGVDMADRIDYNLCQFGQCSDFGTNRLGFAGDARGDIRNITASLGSTATYQFSPWLNFKTTGGVQYNNFLQTNSRAFGNTLPPGAPASQAEAIDLYFREKAFWVFGRGQRLGDLRRLIRQYSRTAANVFPSGAFYKGGSYGADVNFPVTVDEENNPAFKGCTDRNA